MTELYLTWRNKNLNELRSMLFDADPTLESLPDERVLESLKVPRHAMLIVLMNDRSGTLYLVKQTGESFFIPTGNGTPARYADPESLLDKFPELSDRLPKMVFTGVARNHIIDVRRLSEPHFVLSFDTHEGTYTVNAEVKESQINKALYFLQKYFL